MKTTLLRIMESIWRPMAFLLRPEPIQHALRTLGVPLPYRLAKYLEYKGLVKFTVNGQTLVMRSYNTPIEMTIFWRGVFNGREGMELRVWRDLLSADTVVFDVGANNGVYSLLASTVTDQIVYAFEPVPAVRAMLEENVALSERENIRVCAEVVSDDRGQVVMHVPTDTGIWTDIASIEASFVKQRAVSSCEIVCGSTTVDAFVSEKHIDPTTPLLFKIDVEGAETRVIRGMTKTLSQYQIVALVELLDAPAFADFYQYVPSSYKLYAVGQNGLAITPTKVHLKGIRNYVLRKAVAS